MYRYYLTKAAADSKNVPGNPSNVYNYSSNGVSFERLGQVWSYVEYEDELDEATVEEYGLTPAGERPYYAAVSESAAREAKAAYSFYDYVPGSVTADYRRQVDEAAYIAYTQKQRVDPMYHDKINGLLELYAMSLARNIDDGNRNTARVPSILIAGGSNFPVRKKEKQNARAETIMHDYNYIQNIVTKIKSVGTGGIRGDDPKALQKLEAKLQKLVDLQEKMKAVNAYYRKHKTLDGCPLLDDAGRESLTAGMAHDYRIEKKPYPSWALSNNNAEIRRLRGRIEELKKRDQAAPAQGWSFDGGEVKMNSEVGRVQILFDEKPDEATRTELKANGFRWAPSQQAWQRQLTDNGIRAAERLSFAKKEV